MTPEEEAKYLQQYEQELAMQQQMNNSYNSVPYSSTMFGGQPKQNLVEWQLDFKQELEDIERLLRCDIIIRDREGNEVWTRNPNPERIVFNDVGVNDILRQIRMFLNKNKVLSNYDMDEIRPRIRSISHELRMLIYNNYEAYGMDNDYKQNNYPIVILTISAMIEDSYRRALYGEERRDLNQARVVNQNDNPQQYQMQMPMMQQQSSKKSLIKPWTWFS